MFGLGMPEILLILGLALIIIGPKKLPDLAKTLGKSMREFKGAAQDFLEVVRPSWKQRPQGLAVLDFLTFPFDKSRHS